MAVFMIVLTGKMKVKRIGMLVFNIIKFGENKSHILLKNIFKIIFADIFLKTENVSSMSLKSVNTGNIPCHGQNYRPDVVEKISLHHLCLFLLHFPTEGW